VSLDAHSLLTAQFLFFSAAARMFPSAVSPEYALQSPFVTALFVVFTQAVVARRAASA